MTETLHASSSQRNTLSDQPTGPVTPTGENGKRIPHGVRFFCAKGRVRYKLRTLRFREAQVQRHLNKSEPEGGQPSNCTRLPEADAGQLSLGAGLD